MRKNRLNKWVCSPKRQAPADKMWLGIILAVLIALVLFSIPDSYAKEPGKEEEMKPKTTVIVPRDGQPAVKIKPVKPKPTPVLSASAADDKGKQMKWQVVSSGAVQGGTSVTFQVGRNPGYVLSGTVGQLAVGPGSSESYGMNSGYWQEELGGGYLRGDANLDGVIDIADASYLINYLFIGGPPPNPFWVGDANCDDVVDIADASYIINYLFIGGPPPGC